MTKSMEEIRKEILDAQKTGDYLREYDLAQAALQLSPYDEFFQYSSVLALSRCNAKQRALDSFYAYKLHLSDNEYVRALEPRILKDLAFMSLDKDQPFLDFDKELFSTAAVTYHQAFIKTGGHYSAINAATLYLFSGGQKQASELAIQAIEIARHDNGPQYFPLASQAEAYILLNRLDEARKAIELTAKYNEKNLLTRSRTYRQLKLICKYLGIDPEILEPLLPETVIHYCGHIYDQYRPLSKKDEIELTSQIENVISNMHCAVAYGSLAAGADIMFAESVLKQGGELNVWLPVGQESYCDVLVRTAGEDWGRRFHECIKGAHTVSCATESDYLGEDSLFKFCSDVAMGMAIMRANSLNTKLKQLAVWNQSDPNKNSGTYLNLAKWKGLGQQSVIIPCPARIPEPYVRKVHGSYPEVRREPHAILFADIKGYSKLSDKDIVWYFNVFQSALAKAIEEFQPDIQHLDTWGDAIFLVTEKASTAAKIAVALDNAIAGIDQSALGLEKPLLMRIGLHYGPVYKFYDHLTKGITYSSNDVIKTARIEPVTPPGEIFGTEPFVAMLELEGEGWASFEYAGTISSAKNYGAFRMFHVRPKNMSQVLMCSLSKP